MSAFFGCKWSMKDNEVDDKVNSMINAIDFIGVSEDEAIALHVDLSLVSVLLVFASIKMGLRVAICHLRDPVLVMESWLKSLGVNKLISSLPIKPSFDIDLACFSIEELLRSKKPREKKNSNTRFSSIIKTSGTSGEAKSALIFEKAHEASAYAVNNYFKISTKSVWALTLPLYHVSGLSILFRALLANASIYIAKNYDELVFGLKAHRITHLSLVSAQLKRLIDDKIDFAKVEAIIIGGDTIPENLLSEAISLGLPIYETYGLTETASMVWIRDCQKNIRTVLPHAVMHFSEDGEILVKGKSLFAGYIDNDDLYKNLTKDGFFATKDVGQLSCDSRLLSIVGRKSNQIISGGENIQVEEIERVLDAHPLIANSIVVGKRDEKFGMCPCAYIKWFKVPLNDLELLAYLKKHLASHKIPKTFLLWPKDAPEGHKKPRRWFLMNTLSS